MNTRRNVRVTVLMITLTVLVFASWASVSIQTAASQTIIRFAVISDYGVDNGNELKVANMVKGWNPET